MKNILKLLPRDANNLGTRFLFFKPEDLLKSSLQSLLRDVNHIYNFILILITFTVFKNIPKH